MSKVFERFIKMHPVITSPIAPVPAEQSETEERRGGRPHKSRSMKTHNMYGITRYKRRYGKGPPGWVVRVGYSEGQKGLQCKVNDRDHNDCCWESLGAALKERDERVKTLAAPDKPLSGIVGVYRHTGRRGWHCLWRDSGKQESKHFPDSAYDDDSYLSFCAAVECRVHADFREFGYTTVNTYELKEIYSQAWEQVRKWGRS